MATQPDEAVRVRRHPERSTHEAEAVRAVLDEALVAHVGTVRDGLPVVIPMFYARDGDALLLHGAPAAGVLRRAREPMDVCVTVTLLDGLVLARSAFHHSMNYRSVVVVGRAEVVDDPAEKRAALDRFVDRLTPGRGPALRATTDKEIRGTAVLRVPLDRASCKARTGPPVDDEADHALDVWAGVVPVTTTLGAPVPDPLLADGIPVPEEVTALVRGDGEPPR